MLSPLYYPNSCITNIFFDLPYKFQILCIATLYKVTSFPRKDQLPERSSAEWTDAFYRGRRSSRIQVSYFLHFRNQIWYHLCPKFAGLWRGAWNVLPFAGGAKNPWQSGTYSHTRGLRISEVSQVVHLQYNTYSVPLSKNNTFCRRMEDLKNGQLDVAGIEHINEIVI